MTTSYSESSYFEGFHFQHIADYFEHLRLRKIRRETSKIVERSHRQYRDQYRNQNRDQRFAL